MTKNTKFKIACVQTNTLDDIEQNCREVERLIREAAAKGAEFIALPENVFLMWECGKAGLPYFSETEHVGVVMCQSLAKELGVWILIGSIFVPSDTFCDKGREKCYNRSLLINDKGKITARYDKIHLFAGNTSEGAAYAESNRVEYGKHAVVANVPWGKLGMAICYDVRFPYLHRDMAQQGAEIISLPAAFFHYTGQAHWHVLMRARAIENGAFVVAPAQCGKHPGDRFTYGHSLIIDPWGEIIAEASEDKAEVIFAEIDLAKAEEIRNRQPALYLDREFLPQPEYMI